MVRSLNYALANQRRLIGLADRTVSHALLLWNSLPSYRDNYIDLFIRELVPVVRAAQESAIVSTAATIEVTGQALNVVVDPAVDAGLAGYRGVPAGEVYRRPAVTAYTELAGGKSLKTAIEAGGVRLASLVASDIFQASNRQAARSLSRSRFWGFQRVLSGGSSCALCVIASTQRYHRGDLQPMHPGCQCTVLPLKARTDPGQVINENLLDATHEEIAGHLGSTELGARDLGLGKVSSKGRPISDYTDLIISRDHGEYGPTLSWRDHRFTGASHIAALS